MMENGKEKNVLLAEDSFDDVLIFELAVKELDTAINLRHAQDGVVLFVLLDKEVPDMLFLDIKMPCKDGITCLSEIRKNSKYDAMPIIMLTGMEVQNTIEDAYRNGANFYLTKAESIKALSNKLKTIFSYNWKQAMIYPTLDDFVIS